VRKSAGPTKAIHLAAVAKAVEWSGQVAILLKARRILLRFDARNLKSVGMQAA